MVPVLFRAYRSPGYFTLTDVATVAGGFVALAGVTYLVSAAAFGDRAGGLLPALCAMLAVVWLFGFDPAAHRLPRLPHHLSFVLLGVVGVVATVALIRWLERRPAMLRTASVFLSLTGARTVVRFAVAVGMDRFREREEVDESPLRHALARPIPAPARTGGPLRDVYLIVLDEYANEDVLRTVFGYDNRPFLDSLRALGFYVPKSVGSNYAQTTLSLPSLLNAAHVFAAGRELPRGSKDPTLMNRLLGENRVARFLRNRGYRFVLFPSLWWGSTQSSPLADSVVRVWGEDGFHLDRELSRTELRRVLRRATILDYVHRDKPWDAEFVRRTLDGVGRLPSLQGAGVRLRARAEPALALRVRSHLPHAAAAHRTRARGRVPRPAPVPERPRARDRGPPDPRLERAARDHPPGRPRLGHARALDQKNRSAPRAWRACRPASRGSASARSARTIFPTGARRLSETPSPW